jgi:anti-sigma factor RsiW
MHPNDATLLALIHGELDDEAAATVQAHVADCAVCQATEAGLRRVDIEITGLLRALDHPAPTLSPPAARARPRFRHTALAASLALLLAGAAAAAVPGTALNRWIRSRLDGAPPTAPRAASPLPAPAGSVPAQAAAGIEIPAPRTLIVSFAAPETDGMLTVTVADRADATFQAYGGEVAYQVGDGRIAVDNRRPARRYTLEVPAALGRLTVLVAGRRAFDSGDHALGPDPDSISLSPGSAR